MRRHCAYFSSLCDWWAESVHLIAVADIRPSTDKLPRSRIIHVELACYGAIAYYAVRGIRYPTHTSRFIIDCNVGRLGYSRRPHIPNTPTTHLTLQLLYLSDSASIRHTVARLCSCRLLSTISKHSSYRSAGRVSTMTPLGSFIRSVLNLSKSNLRYYVLAALILIFSPLAILLSHPLFTTTLDFSLLVILLVSYYAFAPLPSHYLVLLLLAPSLLRLFAIRYVQGLSSAQNNLQKYLLALLSASTIAVQLAVYVLRRELDIDFPSWLFRVSLTTSVLVLISIVWVPTSHEAAWEAETAVLKDTGLYPHVHRYKKAGLSYILLDHPIHSQHTLEQQQTEQAEAEQAAHSLTHSNRHRCTANSESPRHTASDSRSSAPVSSQSKPALFLLHGYGAGAAFWVHSMDTFAAIYDVYAIDILGFGMSDHESFTAKTPEEAEAHYVQSLHRFQSALKLDQVVLLGHSFGGMIAAAYALRYPSLVQSLILVSPVGIPDPPELDSFRGPRAIYRFRHIFRWFWESGLNPSSFLHFAGPIGPMAVRFIINGRFGRLPQIASTPSFANYMYHINSGKGSGLSTLNALIAPGAIARLPLGRRMADKLTVPTHWLWGEADWMYTAECEGVIDRMRDRGVYSTIQRINGAGHQVSLEGLSGFNTAVMKIGHELVSKNGAPVKSSQVGK